MGLYNISCPASSLYMLGILQIVGFMQKRKLLIEDVFADFFIDSDTEAGWSKIQAIIEPHGLQKLVPTGSIPSKSLRQGDGMFQSFIVSRGHANLAMMFKTATTLGNIKDPDDEYLRVDWNMTDFPIQNQEASMRWNAIISAYEVVRSFNDVIESIFEAIKPLYMSLSSFQKSPMQVYFYSGEEMHGIFQGVDSLHGVPWETINQFKTDNPADPGIIDVMFNFSVNKLWYIPVPTITYGAGTDSFPGCNPTTTYVNASYSDCFRKSGSFTPDPPSPDPPPPDPPYTHVGGGASGDWYTGALFHVTITPGTDPVKTGTVDISYKRIIVTFTP